jgi:CarboxypepD_reg-like domain
MYRKLLTALLAFYSVITGFAQTKISGKVVNEQNDQPIASASIYFNNTSIGVSSDANGHFLIYSPSSVNTDLIVSCVGYETIVYKLRNGETNNANFTFKLRPKENTLKDILVLTSQARERWLTIFRDNFLGITDEGKNARIENEDAIYFTAGESSNSIYAYADIPLIIINKKLGYKIHFQLIEFNIDGPGKTTYFYGYTRYEESGKKRRWEKNRRNCYYGSTMHFYRSIISNKLEENDFEIFLVNTPKRDSANRAGQGSFSSLSTAIKTESSKIMKADSTDTSRFIITCPEKLMVLYKKNTSTKSFLENKILLTSSLHKGYRSDIVFKEPHLIIDKNGIPLNPFVVYYTGFWIYEKVANLLPFDYTPDQ